MISVAEANSIILSHKRDFGNEWVSIKEALGRVLAEDIYSDRDMPPFDRVTMDGIAICFSSLENNINKFYIESIQPAGTPQKTLKNIHNCIEVMTGAMLPVNTDTIIPYEDLFKEDSHYTITKSNIKKWQNIHPKGIDINKGELVVSKETLIDSTIISIAATVGKSQLLVKKTPKIAVISSGDELIDIDEVPEPHQIRKSNAYTIEAILKSVKIESNLFHITDSKEFIKSQLKQIIEKFDILLISGGVSMGKLDFLPEAMNELGIECYFHKVKQRPGKPFWFGGKDHKLVFAFPGNPVSTFMCMHRYFLKWLQENNIIRYKSNTYAKLLKNHTFAPKLQLFLQVAATVDESGTIVANLVEGHGSGDLANLRLSNAFMELPEAKSEFLAGEVYPIWLFKPIL